MTRESAAAVMPDCLVVDAMIAQELPVGRTGWIGWDAIQLDGEGRCWLNRYATVVLDNPGMSQCSISLARTTEGYRLTVYRTRGMGVKPWPKNRLGFCTNRFDFMIPVAAIFVEND